MSKATDERMAWSGQCTECLSIMVLFPSDEATPDVQREISENWPESWADCPVEDCEGEIEWNGNDPIALVITEARR